MKFIRSQKSGLGGAAFLFEMSRQEMDWLVATLKLYPQLDSGYHQITHCAAPEIKAETRIAGGGDGPAARRPQAQARQILCHPRAFSAGRPGRVSFSLPPSRWTGCCKF